VFPKYQDLLTIKEINDKPVNLGAYGRQASASPTYQASHRPMTVEQGAAPLHDLSKAFDENIYNKNALSYYGTGDTALDKEALGVFNRVRGNPNAMVDVYRAVPKDAKQEGLNPGDWVTVSKKYAEIHGEGPLEGNYKIIKEKVPASSLTTNSDSILEQGYYPNLGAYK
jgi:hypothetical protein